MIYLATKNSANKQAGKIENFEEAKMTKPPEYYNYVTIPRANISFAHNKRVNGLSI